MATPRTSKKRASSRARPLASPPDDAVSVQISLEPTQGTPTYYANYFEISSARHDVAILAGRVPAKHSREALEELRTAGVYVIEPEVQLLIAPTLVPGLLKALTVQLAKYEERFGPIPSKESDDA